VNAPKNWGRKIKKKISDVLKISNIQAADSNKAMVNLLL
jgi:hypothetical protein